MMNLLEICKDANTIGITGHLKPDGDCVGSTMGLARFLQNAYPGKVIEVMLQKPNKVFDCICGVSDIIEDTSDLPEEEQKPSKEYDVMFVCDTVAERTGSAKAAIEKAKIVVNIDHHISNPGFGDYFYVVPEASSASELVYDLLLAADPEKKYIDMEVAQAIYLGIVHDTGVFQYSSTTPDTMRKAADLLGYGFDFSKLIDETYYKKTYPQTLVMGRVVLDSIRLLKGRCIVGVVDHEMMKEYGVGSKDFEGIVNQLRNVEGCEVAIFMYEVKDGQFKVSLRSCGLVDVSKISTMFGGGGHKRAAGCTIEGPSSDIIQKLTEQIRVQLGEEVC